MVSTTYTTMLMMFLYLCSIFVASQKCNAVASGHQMSLPWLIHNTKHNSIGNYAYEHTNGRVHKQRRLLNKSMKATITVFIF